MPTHDFSALFDTYPAVIAAMPRQFTSHEFIRELARQQQVLYIEALYAYRDEMHEGKPAPFRNVHSLLARQLRRLPDLVRQLESATSSTDIFGQSNTASKWERLE